ncbi:MAG: hypothetical protein P8R31_09755 [Mariniblastus sp.]|nr:hypothetical protein [Mariniblastus sp.]
MNDQRVSLSFLDVMTCSLGAVLLLFFIVAVSKQDMQLRETADASDRGQDQISLVIIAYSEDDQPLFAGDKLPWKIECLNCTLAVEGSSGYTHAVLYIRDQLPPDARVLLGPLTGEGEFIVQVIKGTQRVLSLSQKNLSNDDFVQVWPPVGKEQTP